MEALDRRTARTGRWQSLVGAGVLVILALTFLVSAVSKLAGMDAFRWALIDAGVTDNTLAALGARLLVGLELVLGMLLLCRLRLRRIAYPAALLLLGIFSAYLIVMLLRQGNAGDCGCFGKWLPMRPLPALLKNAALAAGIIAARQLRVREWRPPAAVTWILALAAAATPFLTAPMQVRGEVLPLSPLYNAPGGAAGPDLRQGRHVVAFMSLGCPHCREAAKIFHRFLQENPALPVVIVLNGTPGEASGFFEETRAQNVPHRFVPDIDSFVRMAGQYVPSIYYLDGGRIERRLSYRSMSRRAIESWAKP